MIKTLSEQLLQRKPLGDWGITRAFSKIFMGLTDTHFRTLANFMMVFCRNNSQLSTVNYFHKKAIWQGPKYYFSNLFILKVF